MGLITQFLKPTPFYKFYKIYLQNRAEKEQLKLETKLHPFRIQFYKQFINSSDLVFDIGANVGNRISAFLECDAKIIAVEPQPSCVKTLIEKFGNRIIIESVGLSEEVGELEMSIASDSTVSSFSKEYIAKTKSRFKYSKWEDTIKVPITTLDILIEKYGTPKFCKIDVEGFELNVLKGLHSKIPYLSIEYCVPEMYEQNLACLQRLQELSPTATFNYSIGESMKWALKEWKPYGEFVEHIKSKEFVETSFGDIYIKSIKKYS